MKKALTIGGALAGMLFGVGIMVFAFIKAPGSLGIFELMLQAAIVAMLVVAGAMGGLLLGWLVSICVRKR